MGDLRKIGGDDKNKGSVVAKERIERPSAETSETCTGAEVKREQNGREANDGI